MVKHSLTSQGLNGLIAFAGLGVALWVILDEWWRNPANHPVGPSFREGGWLWTLDAPLWTEVAAGEWSVQTAVYARSLSETPEDLSPTQRRWAWLDACARAFEELGRLKADPFGQRKVSQIIVKGGWVFRDAIAFGIEPRGGVRVRNTAGEVRG